MSDGCLYGSKENEALVQLKSISSICEFPTTIMSGFQKNHNFIYFLKSFTSRFLRNKHFWRCIGEISRLEV